MSDIDSLDLSVITVTEESIKSMVHIIRGQKVMLASDLAMIYGYTTKAFNQQIKNNIDRFDEDFRFQLTWDEVEELSRSKKLTLNKEGRGGNIKYLPWCFTESGVYMLMTVLKGDLAINQSKAIIRLFKQMKDYLIDSPQMITQEDFSRLSLQTAENTNDIKQLKEEMATKADLEKFMKNFADNHIGKEYLVMNGKTVESDIAYKKVYSQAKKSIYIIDDYIGLKTLYLLKDVPKAVEIIIFSDNRQNHLTLQEYNQFCQEYPDLDIKFKMTAGKYHDRFIFIDYKARSYKVYHCGASSKDGGRRIMAISKMDDKNLYKPMIEELLNNSDLTLR